jgi:DNA/RNA endonuclease YhcR with UshA esterase domain
MVRPELECFLRSSFRMKRPISFALTVLWLASLVVLAAAHEGKEVEVAGVIKMYEGKSSTDISSLEQIHVIEQATSTAPESNSSEPANS